MDTQFSCHKVLLSTIQEYLQKIEAHCNEIGLPYSEFQKLSEISIRKILRTTLDYKKDIENHKEKLTNEIREDIEKVNFLCHQLQLDPKPFLPKESSLYDSWSTIKTQISLLNEQKKKMDLDKFLKLRDHFLHLINVVKKELNKFERHIFEFKPKDNLDFPVELLRETISKLEDLKISNKEQNMKLYNDIKRISEMLKVDEMLPDTSDPVFFQSNTVLELQKKLDRLQALRRSQIKMLFDNIRGEIKELWDKCNLSEEYRQSCKSFYSVNNQDENSLGELEEYLFKLRSVSSQFVSIDDKIKLYWSQFGELEEVEARLNNPEKFLNRGGRMLKDETLKKKLLSVLPKAETEIAQEIQNLSESVDLNLRPDLLSFAEDCKIKWQELHDKKSMETQTRHKNKIDSLNQDLRYGSKPVPVSKKHVAGHAMKVTEEVKKKVVLKPSVKVNNPIMYAVARHPDELSNQHRATKRAIDQGSASRLVRNPAKKLKQDEN